MPLTGATKWVLAIAFLGGLVGGDAISAVFAALGAFALGTTMPRSPWRAAILIVASWAAGTGVGALLNLFGRVQGLEPPSQVGSGLTVLAAYASAGAGAALAWVSSRLNRDEVRR
ncbi:MAG TPA: hypothetical protein VGQ06_13835 [Gemmatimonadales bacterium]|nr:hypothetical protein [Gemmatimonadales bacterium]